MTRLKALARRIRSEGFTPVEFRSICVAALVLLSTIVVTGAAVRLTGSGLGCSDWPNCNDTKLVDVSSKHSAIEQVNRLFTFLVGIGVLLAAAAAWFRRPRRRDLLVLGLIMLFGVPAQGLVGAVVVWTDLHPATVQLHFLLSMALIWAAVTMLVRSGQPDDGNRMNAVVPRVRRRVRLLALWTWLAVIGGTVVTGTGPHAGDEEARRFGLAITTVTRVHSAIVWVTAAVALSLLWQLRRLRHDREVLDAPLTAWLCAAVGQGVIGYLQYFNGVPAALVAVHVAGATTLMACTAWLWSATSRVVPSAAEVRATVDSEA